MFFNKNGEITENPPIKKLEWVDGYIGVIEIPNCGESNMLGVDMNDQKVMRESDVPGIFCKELSVAVNEVWNPVFQSRKRVLTNGCLAYVNDLHVDVRYYRAMCLVDSEEYSKPCQMYRYNSAKFIEEVDLLEVYNLITGHVLENSDIECFQDFKKLKEVGYYTFQKLSTEKKKKERIFNLISHGYSESFATLILEHCNNSGMKKYDEAIAYAKEGLSKDMRAYLLFNKKE